MHNYFFLVALSRQPLKHELTYKRMFLLPFLAREYSATFSKSPFCFEKSYLTYTDNSHSCIYPQLKKVNTTKQGKALVLAPGERRLSLFGDHVCLYPSPPACLATSRRWFSMCTKWKLAIHVLLQLFSLSITLTVGVGFVHDSPQFT